MNSLSEIIQGRVRRELIILADQFFDYGVDDVGALVKHKRHCFGMPLGELHGIRAVECRHTEASSDRVHVAILLEPLVFREFHLATLTQLSANEVHQLNRYVGDIRKISEHLKGF